MIRILKSLLSLLLFPLFTFGQNDVNKILNDLTFYTGKYVAPASEAIVYQAASAWMFSSKLKKDWTFSFGVNTNVFIVPNSNRNFQIKNSDFQIFTIEGVNDDRVLLAPTTLGFTSDIYIQAQFEFLGTQTIRTRFDGINQEQIIYPYLQGSIVLPKGFEFMAKYSLKNTLKNGAYQVFGVALQYNISQYFSKLKVKKFNIATLFAYNKEDVEVKINLASGSSNMLALKSLKTDVSSYQWQINVSKTFNKFEVMFGFVTNISNIKYNFIFFEDPEIDASDLLNTKIKDLDKTQNVFFGEISGRYNIYKDLYLQSTFSIGKNINSNFGLQYEFK